MKTYSFRQILHVAFPVMVSMLMEQLIGLTDTAFLGRVGQAALGASSLGGVFYIVVFMVGLGFCTGSQILMGRRNGEGNYSAIGTIFYHSAAFLLFGACSLFVLTRLWAPSLLESIVSSSDVRAATQSYLYWRVGGFFFAFGGLLFRSFYVATLNTKTLTLNSIVMVVSNVVFNYLLIFGHGGLPAMGVAGAALGSVLAEGVSLLFFIVYTWRRIDVVKYGLHVMPRFRLEVLRRVLAISVWTMAQDVLALAVWFFFFLAVEHLGESELAVVTILRHVSSFCFMSLAAVANTAGTLTSNLMGQRDPDAVVPMLKQTMRLGALILFPMLAVFYLFPTTVLHVFTDDSTLIEMGVVPMYVFLSANILHIPALVLLRAVAGTGNTRAALWTESLALLLYVVFVSGVILWWRAPLWVCVLCEHLYAAACILFCGAYMKWGNWKARVI